MSTSIVQFRVDDDLKEEASVVFEKLGIDLSTALRMFLKRTVLENGIPFPMTLQRDYDATAAVKAVKAMNDEASANGTSDMSLDEINAEISRCRADRKKD